MQLISALVGGAAGLAGGPMLAGLTRSVPAERRGWSWRGGSASGHRIAVVTAIALVVLAAIGGALGLSADLPAFLWLGGAGVALAVIDIDCHRLPNALTFPTYGAGIVLLGLAAAVRAEAGDYVRALIGMAVIFAVFFVLAFAGGIGFGDTKLAGVLGLYLAWLGWSELILGLVAGFVVGGVVAIGLLAARVAGWKTDVAFGPSLIGGALLTVILGPYLLG